MMHDAHGPTSSMISGNAITIKDGTFNQILNVSRRQGFDLLTDMTSPSAFYNAGHSFDFPKCHPNTCVAILDRLKNWTLGNQEPNASILWLYGAAGAGKSCIARSLAEWCDEQRLLLASFFFFRSDPSRNSVQHFIPTLAYNVAQNVPQVRSSIEQSIYSDPHIFSKALDVQMLRLVLEPLTRNIWEPVYAASNVHRQKFTSIATYPRVVIIDGLDECLQSEQKNIIHLFSSILDRNLGWKILVASRPEQAIRTSIDRFVPIDRSARIALSDEYKSTADITRFLEDKFVDIKHTHIWKSFIPSDWPPREDIDKLVRKSSGQFIYAATVIRYVCSDYNSPVDRLRSVLDSGRTLISRSGISDSLELPFAELDTLYAQILQTASGRFRVHNPQTVPLMVALCILLGEDHEFLVLHQSPADAFSKILRLDIDVVSLILAELSSILSVQPWHIAVYHASLGDYLFDRSRSGSFWVDETQLWTDLFCYGLSTPGLYFTPNHASAYWETLVRFMDKARYTAQVSQCMLSYDILPVLEAHCPEEIEGFEFLEVTTFLVYLKANLDNLKDLAQSYRRFMSTFDDWFARKLDEFSQKASTRRAYVAFLCSRTTIEHFRFRLHAHRDSFYIEHLFLSGPQYSKWLDLLENDGRRLPKVRGCIFDDKMQTSAVWLCVHFLVQNAIADGIMRFRRKLFPWLPMRRMCSRRVRGKGGKGPTQHWYLPFVGKVGVGWLYDNSRRQAVDKVMSIVLRSLVVLLGHIAPSPRIVFALRMAASLVCTQRRHRDSWQRLRKTIRRYLVDVAGLKLRSGSGFGFVEVSTAYRFQGWSRSQMLETHVLTPYLVRVHSCSKETL